MNTLRQPYNELSPEVYNALVQAKIALEKSELDGALIRAGVFAGIANQRLRLLPGDAQQSPASIRRRAKQAGRPGRLAGERPFQRCGTRGAGVGGIGHPYRRKPCGRRRLSTARSTISAPARLAI